MARGSRRAYTSIVVGVVLGGTATIAMAGMPAFTGHGGAGLASLFGQAASRPARIYSALSSGIDYHRRGDYERAGTYLQQAQAGQDCLSNEGRQELHKYLELNNAALKSRREGTEQVLQAEKAIKDGRAQDAETLLKAVSTNQFLPADVKQKVIQLTGQIRPVSVRAPDSPSTGVPSVTLARAKLQQARSLLQKAQFDAAEALAHEAIKLGAIYDAGEDTPAKVLDDSARTRGDPKLLLNAARVALQRGDLDRAEELAYAADRASSFLGRHPLFGDSPSKVLKDVQAARVKVATQPSRPAEPIREKDAPTKFDTFKNMFNRSTPAPVEKPADKPPSESEPSKSSSQAPRNVGSGKTVVVTPASKKDEAGRPGPSSTSTPNGDKDAARQKLKQARQAIEEGRLDEAKQLVAQAGVLSAEYNWWDDTPQKVQADIQRAAAKTPGALARDDKPAVVGKAKGDPRSLLKQAREKYQEAKFEEAEKLAIQVKVSTPTGWGLFEDSPEKVLLDIRRAVAKNEREESGWLLSEARKLYDAGKLEEARAKAGRAEQLHGPYSIWDLGDRPQKLLAEIEVAEATVRHTKPEAPTATVQVGKPPQAIDADKAPPSETRGREARRLLVQARESIRQGDFTRAQALARQAEALGVPQVADADSPAAVRRDIQIAQSAGKQKPVLADPTDISEAAIAPPTGKPLLELAPEPAVAEAARKQALQLLAEVRTLEKAGRLVEARTKAMEAQKLNAPFQADEDRPERALLDLAGKASKRIDSLVQKSAERTLSADPDRFQKAEEDLAQAHALASGFALDTDPIDTRLAWVRQAHEKLEPSGPALHAVTPPAAPGVTKAQHQEDAPPRGQDLLERARVELNRGDTGTARRLAQEAFSGNYGVGPQAEAVLRSIDAEEFNQRRLVTSRSFQAGLSAYHRKDVIQAAAIWKTIDMSLLDADKLRLYKEIMRTPEMQPQALAQAVAPMPSAPGAPSEPGKVSVGDPAGTARVVTPEDSPAQRVSAMLDIQFQKLRDDSLKAQREALERFRAGEPDRAMAILHEYLDGLNQAQLEPARLALLRRPIDSRLEQFKTLKLQNEMAQVTRDQKSTVEEVRAKMDRAERLKQQNVADLMKQYHTFYKEGKYREAELAAMKAHELDPDNVAADAAIHVARIHGNQVDYSQLKERKEKMFIGVLNDAEDEGPLVTASDPMKFPAREDWASRDKRKDFAKGLEYRLKTEKEREIERRLSQPISFDFKNQPLQQVIEELRDLSGINVVPDTTALKEDGINLERPLTMKLEGVSLKSALNLLLQQARLTYVIKDEVLNITTPSHAQGKLVPKTYQVADLVIPVENFTLNNSANVNEVVNRLNNQQGGLAGAITPYTGQRTLPNGSAVGTPGDGSVSPGSPGSPNAPGGKAGNFAQQTSVQQKPGRAPGQTLEDVLIKLITNTIEPQSWSEMGGPGTIDYFPLGMALVVNQTPDIQEQVAELLAALRRLQDVEVAIEVRFITISESFYERIGMDFNVNILTDTAKFEPSITTGQFKPPLFVNDFEPSRFVAGLTPAGTFTHDLDIPIKSSSFGPSIPNFGLFPIAPGADGGLTMGLAFLSDIQVFLFMEAAQGDRRTNIMQAPKLTMFNAQTATILVQDTTFFVIGNLIGLFNGQVVYNPQNQGFGTGVQLTMQPVVSADRRFVRISMAPTLTNLSTPLAALFPFTTIITPVFDTGFVGQPIPITQFVQQPNFTTVGVQTTVSVPDGGTVLLGGLKTLAEGRNEFGPPILSKLPYVNRLFKNVGYGRDAASLMLMVTPRIIINEEEEVRFLGGGAP